MPHFSSLTEVMDEAEFYGRYKKTLLKDDPVVWGFARSLSFTSPSSLVGRSETILERCFLDEFTRTSSLYWQVEFLLDCICKFLLFIKFLSPCFKSLSL